MDKKHWKGRDVPKRRRFSVRVFCLLRNRASRVMLRGRWTAGSVRAHQSPQRRLPRALARQDEAHDRKPDKAARHVQDT